MSEPNKIPHVVISDREPGLPYSKGLMASQVMVSGLSPFRAYQVAERIEERLFDRGSSSVTSEELHALAAEVLEDVAGERYAKNFLRWQDVEALDIPLVVLIGTSRRGSLHQLIKGSFQRRLEVLLGPAEIPVEVISPGGPPVASVVLIPPCSLFFL